MTISFNSAGLSSLALFGLNQATNQLTLSTTRLASGTRFASAGDDVGSFSIATRLQSNIVQTRMAVQNVSQASSLLESASDGLTEIQDILDEMDALATAATSGALTDADRALLDIEYQDLIEQINDIAETTQFGDITLLDGSLSGENDVTNESSAMSEPRDR